MLHFVKLGPKRKLLFEPPFQHRKS